MNNLFNAMVNRASVGTFAGAGATLFLTSGHPILMIGGTLVAGVAALNLYASVEDSLPEQKLQEPPTEVISAPKP